MSYSYLSGDGVPIAQPLFQMDGDGVIPISPLQFQFQEIDVPTAIELNQLWHSRLPRVIRGNIDRNRHKDCYAAEFGNRFYASAIWTTPVAANRFADGFNMLELRRLAISNIAPRNTASRVISWMVKDIKIRFPEVKVLISYQDTEVHLGTIYKAAGWSPVAKSNGGEWNRELRPRVASQTIAEKIRWEKKIN